MCKCARQTKRAAALLLVRKLIAKALHLKKKRSHEDFRQKAICVSKRTFSKSQNLDRMNSVTPGCDAEKVIKIATKIPSKFQRKSEITPLKDVTNIKTLDQQEQQVRNLIYYFYDKNNHFVRFLLRKSKKVS